MAFRSAERAKHSRNAAILLGALAPNAVFGGSELSSVDYAGLGVLSSPAVGSSLRSSQRRVDPSVEGIYLSFTPVRFTYKHEYPYSNLPKEASSVYFLLPRNCQEHTIISARYYIAGSNTPLKYEIIKKTPGWQVARAVVPPSKNFSVVMEVSGILWNGKMTKEPSRLPEDIAPPRITDELMEWYKIPSPYFAASEPAFSDVLERNGLKNLGSDFTAALVKIFTYMAKNLQYNVDGASPERFFKGFVNCNGSNRALSTIFDMESSGAYVGVELNGIVMTGGAGGLIHAMSLVGKRTWNRLIPTDAVKFNNGNLDPYYLAGHALGPMLIFQEGLAEPGDPKGGVVFRIEETGEDLRGPNPGGVVVACSKDGTILFGDSGTIIGGGNVGRKVSYASSPITDFDALRRQLKLIEGNYPGSGVASGGSK